MKPVDLHCIWQSTVVEEPVISFYSHRQGDYRCFSNFFVHAPFSFVIPECCNALALTESGRSVNVQISFTEKAIMLCKASIMQDYIAFDRILHAQSPNDAKRMGREVAKTQNTWNQELWDANMCEIALNVVTQKFEKVSGLARVLKSTGNNIIAEMTDKDVN